MKSNVEERERDGSFVKTVEESDAEFWGFVERECELGDTSYDFRVRVSRVSRERESERRRRRRS